MKTAERWAGDIRADLRSKGSTVVARSSQRFFAEAVESHGWRTADLRRYARAAQKEILADGGDDLLLQVADRLFTGKNNEETHTAVILLQDRVRHCGDAEFKLFERWLRRITNWSQHDGLVHYLIGPMMVADRKRVSRIFVWAKSNDRWHRRAAAVALVHPARRKMYFAEIKRVSGLLLNDDDDMVQKGVGWLLRESAKADRARTVAYLTTICHRAPRFVLRTACETLPVATRRRVLG
jgi:3-methyladenine DNA glycosylase AlkD